MSAMYGEVSEHFLIGYFHLLMSLILQVKEFGGLRMETVMMASGMRTALMVMEFDIIKMDQVELVSGIMVS